MCHIWTDLEDKWLHSSGSDVHTERCLIYGTVTVCGSGCGYISVDPRQTFALLSIPGMWWVQHSSRTTCYPLIHFPQMVLYCPLGPVGPVARASTQICAHYLINVHENNAKKEARTESACVVAHVLSLIVRRCSEMHSWKKVYFSSNI